MICLTGDVHHDYDGLEQRKYDGSEVDAAKEYSEIASRHDIDITLFVTGKAVQSEREELRTVADRENVEIGGHTWSAFRPTWLHRTVFKRLFGSIYGPKTFQRYDIRRTLRVLENFLGEPVTSWRTHAYASTDATYEILSDSPVEVISDKKKPDALSPYEYTRYALHELPINVIPDHEHIYHGARTHESVQENIDAGWSDPFGHESYSIEQWTERVIDTIDEIEQKNGVATLLIHPGCMKVADDLHSFERICEHISSRGYTTKTVRDLSTGQNVNTMSASEVGTHE